MSPNDIRSTVGSFYKTTTEQELLGCIAMALAGILEHLDHMRDAGGPSGQCPTSSLTSLETAAA